jgi:secreted Zn-dependent insulinase-like peptidase
VESIMVLYMKITNIIKYLVLIAFPLIVFFIATDFKQRAPEDSNTLTLNPVLKSAVDSTTYSQVNLKNGINTLIVNRDNQQRTSILVGVKVGSINDPEFIPGISHLMEHLVISGRYQEYKNRGEFRNFVKSHGGSIEANITRLNTIFEISIDDKYYKETLKKLADLIGNPLFEEDMIQKEIQIIDAEAIGLFPTLDYKINKASSFLSGTDHSIFNVFPGNKESLYSNRNITEIKSLLEAHHARFYNPDNINIVIISGIKKEDVAKNANETFGAITDNTHLNPKDNTVAVEVTKPGYVYRIKDKDLMDHLIIQIPLNNHYPIFRGDLLVSSLIDEIFYGRSNKSIYNILINTGYISNMSVKLPYGLGFPDMYCTTLNVTLFLTPKGKKHENDLLNVFFAHFSDLNTQESISDLLIHAEEKAQTGRSPFIAYNPRALLERFMYAPIDQITNFSLLANKSGFTKDVLSSIQPSRSNILRFDNSDIHHNVSKFDNIKFSKEPLKIHPVKATDINSVQYTSRKKRRLPNADGTPIHEQTFSDNAKIIVKREPIPYDASFLNATISSSFKLSNKNELVYLQALKTLTNFNEITLPMSCQKTGRCIIDFSDFGKVSFEFGGNAIEARDQLHYIVSAVDKLYQIDGNDAAVIDALNDACKMEFVKISSFNQAFERLKNVYKNNNITLWKNAQHWNCEGTSREGFISFYKKFINESQISISVNNAISDTTMRAFTTQLATLVSEKSMGYAAITENNTNLEKAINLESPIKNGGEMLMSAFIHSSTDNRSIALTRMIVPEVDAQYFGFMRYIHNTGYLVETKFDMIDGSPALILASTSYVIKGKDIQLLHNKFISEFIKNIETNIPDDIEPLKNLTISELSGSKVLHNTLHCVSSNSCKSEFEAIVKSISRDELIAFTKNLFAKQTLSM